MLEAPWKDILRGHLMDKKTYYPPGFEYEDPSNAPGADRERLLRHLVDIGHLRFHHFKLRNGQPQEPVPMEERWWVPEPEDTQNQQLQAEKQRAMDARPGTYLPRANPGAKSSAAAGLDSAGFSGPAGSSEPARGSASRAGKAVVRLSPYGSTLAIKVHSEDAWQESDFLDPPHFRPSPDPDDALPQGAFLHDLDAPASIPRNAEAMAQWCWKMLDGWDWDAVAPTMKLQYCVRHLAELPVS